MGNNLKILNEWNKTISCYKTLKFVEARELYQKTINTHNNSLKRKYI